jgi:hypothetical protein
VTNRTVAGSPHRDRVSGRLFLRKVEMNEFEQLLAAEVPLQSFEAEFPGRIKRRVLTYVVTALVLIVFGISVLLFVNMNGRIQQLNRTVTSESRQIQHLQSNLNAVNGSLGAAVACLQTVGSLEGICTKFVK